MTNSDRIPPTLATPPVGFNRDVVALVYDGLCSFEFACAGEVFGLPRPELGEGWYRFATCAVEPGPLRASYGLQLQKTAGLRRLASAGTIIVPGWKGIEAPVPDALVRALRSAHARGARLLSICSGSVVLAATGLLDGRRATTHWRYAEAFQRRFPKVEVDPAVLYVDEGQVLTSAGSAAGLDLCLHVVRRDFGAEIANLVARRLVIPPHRDGGQAQFVERPVAARERNPMSALTAYMQLNLAEPMLIADLARRATMSQRSFMRHFKQATGTTPADWLVTARLARAREMLEESAWSIEHIAAHCGFGTAMTLRHHFRVKLGLSPSSYRERFAR